MHTRRVARGLTLLDAVLAGSMLVLAWMAWSPGRHIRDVLAAEDVATATLQDLATRVDQHRTGAATDVDGDGMGETPAISVLVSESEGFRPDADGSAWQRDGYWFTLLVPGGDRLPHQPDGTEARADLAEATYVLIAWPVEPGVSGMRAYLRTPLDGVLRHAVDGYPYGGPDKPPAPRVALLERRAGTLRPISLKDGSLWVSPRETLKTSR